MTGFVCKLCLAKGTQAICEGVSEESNDACAYWSNISLSNTTDPANPTHK